MVLPNRWAIFGAISSALILFVAVNVVITGLKALATPEYWQDRMQEPVAPNAVRLVAMGDSSVEAIGASRPIDGYVGLIASYIQHKTGRPVYIANVATGGTTADIIQNQLPKVDLKTADLVIVADDNDTGIPLAQYRAELETLMAVLPPDRTIYSDLPGLPGEAPYQQVLQQVTDAHGIMRADFAAVFNGEGRRLDIFSWLPPHLNSKGYAYWFEAFKPKVDVVLKNLQEAVR
jgi:lysophospholipase L1-like esterase